MKKLNIIADDKIPFLKGTLDNYCNIKYLAGAKTTAKIVKEYNTNVLITRTRTKCTAQLLENSQVKFIGTATIGHDHIDKKFCSKNNIMWTNAPGCNANSVAQYIASALINVITQDELKIENLTLGIIGVGNVGTAVMKTAKNLGLNVLLNDPPKAENNNCELEFKDLDYVLKNSDIISMHTPLTTAENSEHPTLHLADDNFFSKMKNNAYFINSGRGEVVKSSALKKVLKEKKIKDAILDVWENEPNIDSELLNLVRYGTPHIAGYSLDGKANGTAQIVNKLAQNFSQIPVELKTWYPENITKPNNSEITINNLKLNSNNDFNKILNKIINESYNIENDYQRLKTTPEEFEAHRGNYPLRREFSAFSVVFSNKETLANHDLFEKLISVLKQLKFNVQ